MADGAAGGERAVEVNAALRGVAAQAEADGLRGLENDQRIDGAARTDAHGGGDGLFGLPGLSEARERPGLRAEKGSANWFVLATRKFRIVLLRDRDDLLPILECFAIHCPGY